MKKFLNDTEIKVEGIEASLASLFAEIFYLKFNYIKVNLSLF